MISTRRRMAASVAVALALFSGMVGWATPATSAAAVEVSIEGVRFVPPDVTITAGQAITWVHRDSSLSHHVAADDGSFDSHPTCGRPGGICMKGGASYEHTFASPGTYGYHCRLHGGPGNGMVGTVTVMPR